MIANEVWVSGAFEIPDVEVDDEFDLKVRVRVFAIERDRVDVSTVSGPDTVPGKLRLVTVALNDLTPPDLSDSLE